MKKLSEEEQRAENKKTLIFLGCVAVVVLIGLGIAGNGTVKAIGIWLGGLGLLVVFVAAVVGTWSASWTAGRRVASVQTSAAVTGESGARANAETALAGTGAVSTELAELAKLHREGILTPEEFAAAKARVLGTPSLH